MHERLLRAALSFLSGAVWALLVLFVALTFIYFIRSSLFEAILFSFWVGLFWLFLAVLVELGALQLEKLAELRRQRELLERIAQKLDETR